MNICDRIRREYASKGLCQPHNHIFPKKKYGKDNISLEMLGLRTIFGWNIVYEKMLLFAFCVFFQAGFYRG